MKLNYKTSIIGILCFSAIGLAGLTWADSKSELRAELDRLVADIDRWNALCAGARKNSAEGQQCLVEKARLEHRKASLEARIKAASGR